MEVRPGYERTDVGVIPKDWEVEKLGNCLIGTPDYGINAPAVPYSDRLPVYIRITDITDGGRFSKENITSVECADTEKYSLNVGDIVFARTGASVGKSYLYDPDDGQLVFAGFLIRVKPNPTKLNSHFLSAYVKTGRYWKWVSVMSMRSGQPGINGAEYAQLPIPLPPLTEQRAIAEVLSDVDALTAALDRLIAKKRAIKQGAMQQLLTGQTRLPGFKEEWEVKTLGEVCKITTGSKDVNEGNPNGEFPFFTCSRSFTYSDTYSFDTEAILIAGNGDVGTRHYYKGKFEAYQRTYVLDEFQVAIRYIDHYLEKYLIPSLVVDRIGTSIPYIKLGNLLDFEVAIPSDQEEVDAITTILSDMDAESTALEARREKTRALKQGMMQELLTGKTRLV